METDVDQRDADQTKQKAATKSRRVRQAEPVAGGKALARLRALLDARGLADPLDEPVQAGAPRSRGAAAGGAADAVAPVPDARWANSLADADTQVLGSAVRGGPPPAWRPLGPTVMHNGQTYGSGTGSRVDVAGRVATIAVDPANSNHLLVGAAGGGIWESTNLGATWAPRGDALPTLAIGALCFDPNNTATVYAGTGEGNAYAGLGQGVFRSTNGGTTWALRAGAPFIGVGFHAMRVDPGDSNSLYAATRAGVYTSSDAGVTWTRRRTPRCYTVSVHPSGGNTEVLASFTDGVFRSTDRGATWTAVALPGVPNPAGFSRIAACHAALQRRGGLGVGSDQPADRRTRWREHHAHSAAVSAHCAGRSLHGDRRSVVVDTRQAWYDWHVHAPPNSEARVYLGAIHLYRVDLGRRGTPTWTNISSKTSGDSIHPDQHSMAFDPANGDVVYAGNDGGIYRSPNRGVNWAALNDGLAITEVEYISQDPGSVRWIIAGTQDNGSIRYTGRNDWDHVADGDGGDCGVNNVDPTRVYHSYYRMGYDRSTDRGDNWAWVATGSRDPSVYGQLFYPPMEASGGTVAQAGESVFVSRDSGATQVEVALPGRPIASAMYAPNADTIFVGTTGGNIFRLTWSGTAWSAATALTSPRAAYISDMFVDAADHNRIWLTYSQLGGGRVFVTTDGGTNWTDRSAGLPTLPFNAVEMQPGNPNRAWVGADKGVYETLDGGATWNSMSNGLPNCIVGELAYHKHARRLRAGTRSRGVWEIDVDGVLSQPICGVQFTGSLAANQTGRWFTFGWPATWHMIWTVMPTNVRSGAPQIWFDVQVERADARVRDLLDHGEEPDQHAGRFRRSLRDLELRILSYG